MSAITYRSSGLEQWQKYPEVKIYRGHSCGKIQHNDPIVWGLRLPTSTGFNKSGQLVEELAGSRLDQEQSQYQIDDPSSASRASYK